MLGFLSSCDIGIGGLNSGRVLGRDQLESLIHLVASRLSSLGLAPGEVVLYQGPQQASALVLFWACMLNGSIFAPVDEGWPAFQLAKAAGAISPRLVASTSRSVAAAATVFPDAEHLWLEPESDLSDLDGLAKWARGAAHSTPVHMPGNAPAAYLFTSGTSGVPKAVVHTRQGLVHGAEVTLKALEWEAGERLVNLPDPYSMSGLRNAFLAAPLGGLKWLPLPERDRPNFFALLAQLEQAQCHRLVVGPLFLRQLALLQDRVSSEAFRSVKAIYCTGAALDSASARQVYERLGVPVINYYGLTETGGICLSQSLAGWSASDRSVGRPVGCEVRLVSDGGRPSAPGEEGELEVRSPQLMTGYLNDPKATTERFRDGWLRTGDLFRCLSDGSYELEGRASQFINALSTDRVHPEEIEHILERHEAVAEAAVYGRAEIGGGERIAALIVPRRRADDDEDLSAELAAFVAEHLGPARRPSFVRMVQQLPRLGNGKLIRHRLQDLG
jgi:acyl-coenzyme A synthetase/AMP-(fatty) acid ligase